MESRLLQFRAQLEGLVTDREAMVAANKEREQRDESLAYSESAFDQLSHRFEQLILEIRNWT